MKEEVQRFISEEVMEEGLRIISEEVMEELMKIIKNDIFEEELKNKLVDELVQVIRGIFEVMNGIFDKVIVQFAEKLQKIHRETIEEMNQEIKISNEQMTKNLEEEMQKIHMEAIEKVQEVKKSNKEMIQKLEEERCELEQVEYANSALLLKDRQSNNEIQEAHKELIRGYRDMSCDDRSTIGVKRMGQLDEKPFMQVCKQRFVGQNIELEHDMLYCKWKRTLKDPAWYPFKRVGTGEKMKEVVDEEDEKLKNLRQEWGEDVKNAVKTALEELNEFNPSGRYPVQLLWNFEQGRKATLKEGIAQMTKEVKTLKRQQLT